MMNGHSNVMTDTIPRRYWSILELAEEFGVNPSTVRYWERRFNVPAHRGNTYHGRKYGAEDANKLREIYRLLKLEKFTLQGAKRHLSAAIRTRTVKVSEPLICQEEFSEEITNMMRIG